MFNFNISLEIHPIYEPSYHQLPIISYGCGDRSIASNIAIGNITNIDFAGTENDIWVAFLNKNSRDTVVEKGWDKAIEIKNIRVQGFDNEPLQYHGVFMNTHTNYLAFNDTWKYEFTLPIFTWIHKKCEFGWIFD